MGWFAKYGLICKIGVDLQNLGLSRIIGVESQNGGWVAKLGLSRKIGVELQNLGLRCKMGVRSQKKGEGVKTHKF